MNIFVCRRIWYRRVDDWQPIEDAVDKPVLKYINLMPARLESTPRAFGPKFQTLNDSIQSLNRQLQDDPKMIKGKCKAHGDCNDVRI